MLTGSLMALAGACGVLDTDDDRRAAEELADKHLPGQLKAIGARTLFPGTGGSEVTFAVADDRDAVVRLRIDKSKGSCDGKACAGVLTEAVARARTDAAEFRTLRDAFDSCGYEVIALGTSGASPHVVAELTNDSVEKVISEIGGCVQRWVAASGPEGRMGGAKASHVNVVSPAVAAERKRGKDSWPTLMRLTRSDLVGSLTRHTHHSVSYEIEGGQVDTAGRARVVRPFEQRQEFGRTVQKAVADELRATYPDVVVSDYQWVWRLEPGRMDRQTGYLLFCPRPDERGRCVNSDDAVLVTTDERGNPVEKLRIVHDVRDGTGALRLPPY
ncbi:hypothetical protein GTY66_14800 [Streptomyces sp. SID8356]|nr:hypothetical protein [Streptomyces sp. SID8356]